MNIFPTLINNTRRVTRSFRPDLLELFRYARRKLELKCHVEFRIGDIGRSSHALALSRNRRHSNIVLVSDDTLELLDREELLFVIGHELAHIAILNLPTAVDDDASGEEIIPELGKCPPEVREMVLGTYNEIFADFGGVLVAGGVDAAISAKGKFFSDCGVRKDIERIDDAVTRNEFAQAIFQMKVLKLMDKAEAYYDHLGIPLFKTGKKLISDEAFFSKVGSFFREWLDCPMDQYVAMTESADAAYYILMEDGGRGMKILPVDEIGFESYDYRPGNISRFSGVEDAYSRISESSPVLLNMSHPLKYRIFQKLAYAAFELEQDVYVVEDFLREIGGAFGLTSGEVRQYLNLHHHRFEMKKAS